jgi:acyl carrier protein
MLEQRVRRLLAESLRIDESHITTDSRLVPDLGAKSLDILEVILRLEEEFDVEIPDHAEVSCPFKLTPEMTVRDLVRMLGQ